MINKLAQACNNGACNIKALVRSLNEAFQTEHIPDNDPALKVIFGHLQFLAGDGIGPSQTALNEFSEKIKNNP